jgi:AcrR family transcriptional regulator
VTLPLTRRDVRAARQALAAAATRLYLQGGLAALSMRALGGAAGVSRTTPYRYFASKDDIVDAVRAAGFDRLTAKCREAIGAAPDVFTRMRALGWAVVRFALAEPDIYRLMFARPVFTGAASRALRAAIARFRAASRPPLDEAIRRKLVRGDAARLRRATWAAHHGLIMLYLHGHLGSERRLAADFDTLNHIIGFGILTTRRQPHDDRPRRSPRGHVRRRHRAPARGGGGRRHAGGRRQPARARARGHG